MPDGKAQGPPDFNFTKPFMIMRIRRYCQTAAVVRLRPSMAALQKNAAWRPRKHSAIGGGWRNDLRRNIEMRRSARVKRSSHIALHNASVMGAGLGYCDSNIAFSGQAGVNDYF
jgi:hypothetical protein